MLARAQGLGFVEFEGSGFRVSGLSLKKNGGAGLRVQALRFRATYR